MKTVLVIGGGFAGMSAAAYLSCMGMKVILVERHSQLGGRARTWQSNGYTFDMGPSWYLMPEVFDRFFTSCGRDRRDYYSIKQLDPSYRVFFKDKDSFDIRADLEKTLAVFDGFEKGGGMKLKGYLADAAYKYRLAMDHFLYREYDSFFQFFNFRTVFQGLRLGVFGSLHNHVKKYFSDRRAQRILEYAMVFLGTNPIMAPALYSIMSHVDLVQGVFFPHGGMGMMVSGIKKLLNEIGVSLYMDTEVQQIIVSGSRVQGVETNNGFLAADIVLGTGDYHHLEHSLLTKPYRNRSQKYWNRATIAPSMFILYLGVSKKIHQLVHHNLFFSDEWNKHFYEVFNKPQWPENPSYYVSSVSYDDSSMSPQGTENIFMLVPIAAGLEADDEYKQLYADKLIRHLEELINESIRDYIEVQRIYSTNDFQKDYHAFKGTALGLAHTLSQTAVFRPPIRNKKLNNLYYSGQYTHPGIGVPMTFIAADVIARAIQRDC